MSNGYNDYVKEMNEYVRYSSDKRYMAVQYNKNNGSIDSISYEYCDLLCDDIKEFDSYIMLDVGDEFDNHDGTWTKNFKYNLVVLDSEWIVYDNSEDKLFVVDDKDVNKYLN